jgi:tetratricopeptide (TPR) repeat protein
VSRSVAALFVAALLALTNATSPQKLTGGELLTRYARGDRELALPTPFDAKSFLASVADVVDKGLPGPPETARRSAAAFVLEAAAARLDAGDIAGARAMAEWGCARVRAHEPADVFDVAWHAAALSIIEGFLDPAGLETHVRHSREQLQNDPLQVLAWAVAAEQRASPVLRPAAAVSGLNDGLAMVNETGHHEAETERLMDDAATRLTAAAALPAVASDARLRSAHLHLMRGESQDAVSALTDIERTTREGWLVYLARLFRGQALEQLKRPAEAAASFRDALKVGPGGQTATLSLAAVLYGQGQRGDAETLVTKLLAETDPISDPWWTYWAGSARLWTTRLTAMRALLQ